VQDSHPRSPSHSLSASLQCPQSHPVPGADVYPNSHADLNKTTRA
jgi:hypothetical protein